MATESTVGKTLFSVTGITANYTPSVARRIKRIFITATIGDIIYIGEYVAGLSTDPMHKIVMPATTTCFEWDTDDLKIKPWVYYSGSTVAAGSLDIAFQLK